MKNIKNIFLLFSIVFFIKQNSIVAQKQMNKEKLLAAKKEFLLNKLQLGENLEKSFWALYEEHETVKMERRTRIKQIGHKLKQKRVNETEALEELKKIQKIRQAELNTEKEYLDKYIKAIGASKVLELYYAEHDFKEILIEKLNKSKRENTD